MNLKASACFPLIYGVASCAHSPSPVAAGADQVCEDRAVAPPVLATCPICPVVAESPPVAAAVSSTGTPIIAMVGALAHEPKLLSQLFDEHSGVLVMRNLGCEREQVFHEVTHMCDLMDGKKVEPVLDRLKTMFQLSLSFPEEPGVTCSGALTGTCTVFAHGECQSQFELHFYDGWLTAIIERDDWNSANHREFDDEIKARMASAKCSQ